MHLNNIEIFLKKKKKKSDNMGVNNIENKNYKISVF